MNFLRAILMTVLLMVIMAMTNSPPVFVYASSNSNAGAALVVKTQMMFSSTMMAIQTTAPNAVLGVADIKKDFSSSVVLTANTLTVSTVKNNTSLKNQELAQNTPGTTLMRDDRSHLLKHPLTSVFSATTAITV